MNPLHVNSICCWYPEVAVVFSVVITLARSPEPEVVINVTTIRVRSERPGPNSLKTRLHDSGSQTITTTVTSIVK